MAFTSFKDVGVRADIARSTVLDRNRTSQPYGINTPLELNQSGDSRSIFRMHYVLADQIQDNLRNLLLTNHGERLSLYTFGANLRPLLTEYSNKDEFDSEAMIRINTAIAKWMPFVSPVGFDSIANYEESYFTGRLRIILSYGVPTLNIRESQLEVELFVI